MFYDMSIDLGINYPKPFKEPDVAYVGILSVFSGCSRACAGMPCPDCQSPHLWSNLPPVMSLDKVESYLKHKSTIFSYLDNTEFYHVIIGGEPLDQTVSELDKISTLVKKYLPDNSPLVLFSGYDTISDVDPSVGSWVKDNVTYLKLGRFTGNATKVSDLPSGLATPNQIWVHLNGGNSDEKGSPVWKYFRQCIQQDSAYR
jgi:hypothetical protein